MGKVHNSQFTIYNFWGCGSIFFTFCFSLFTLFRIFVAKKSFLPMRLRNTLATIIIIKLIIIAIIKLVFFPDFLTKKAPDDKAGYVATQILNQ